MGMDVDMTGLVAVLGGLGTVGGIGGIVALLKVRKDNGLTEANTEKVHGDLASTVNTSAMGWVKYLDEKIDKVSTDFDEHRRQT
jgi:hypothetical protein